MTEHLLSKDEIDALLHASVREERSSDSEADERGADPEALGQLWRLFLTATAERWNDAVEGELSVSSVRVQWGTAEELFDGQPAGPQVDVLLAGSLGGAATGRFWTATSAADATAFATLGGQDAPWGDPGDSSSSAVARKGGAGEWAEGDGSAEGAEDAASVTPDATTGDPADNAGGDTAGDVEDAAKRAMPPATSAAAGLLRAVTAEMESLSEQVFPQAIAFTYRGEPAVIDDLRSALQDVGDEVLVELSFRLFGRDAEVPMAYLLDGESTDALLARLSEQAAREEGAPLDADAGIRRGTTPDDQRRSPSPVESERPASPGTPATGGAGAGSPAGFKYGISGAGRPKTESDRSVAISPAQFLPIGETGRAEGDQNLDLILDVPLQVRVELGRTRMQIRGVLDLGKGSVVELDKLAGEPVDVLVNGKLLAKGEVVVIDENFGVKITDIVSPMERIRDLQ